MKHLFLVAVILFSFTLHAEGKTTDPSTRSDAEFDENPASNTIDEKQFQKEVSDIMDSEGWNNPASTATAADKSPGSKVIHLKDGSVAKQILQKGDILENINDSKVTGPKSSAKLISQLNKPGRHTVKVRRDGKQQTLDFVVEQ